MANQFTAKEDLIDRLKEKTIYQDECWIYTGAPSIDMVYDAPRIYDKEDGKQHPLAMVVYKRLVGPIKRHMCILHTCDNARCWNIKHLYQGTKQQNTRDMLDRGRHVSPLGEANGMSKITLEQAVEVKTMLKAGGSTTIIGRRLGINPRTVNAIKHGLSWKHVVVG